MNIGIDFGSTYTLASMYDENTGILSPFYLNGPGNSPNSPTVVAKKEGLREPRYGTLAKFNAGKKGWQTFKGFKMLISETDTQKLRKRGFDKTNSPQLMTELYLGNMVKTIAVNNNQGEPVEKLVVGAPEVWFKQLNTLSARSVLRNICRKFKYVNPEKIEIISEPACASAFFAYNYMTVNKKPFSGHILLIDYGGGTLDINLTKITADKDDSDRQFMEIKVLESTGAGENTEGEIGQAGILYMEAVAKKALCKSKIWDADHIPEYNEAFYKFVNDLETNMVTRSSEIRDRFIEICINEKIPEICKDDIVMEELEAELFEELEYDREYVEVSYATLMEVYYDVIYNTLQSKMQEMQEFINSKGINTDGDEFKIALVGGFGNYYLVRKQVEEFFDSSSQSISMKDIIKHEEDRERAISYGAALLASNIIGIKQTAPYSIGLYSEAQKKVYYAFRYKQDLEFNKPYYVCDDQCEDDPIGFSFVINQIQQFALNLGHNEKTTQLMIPQEKFQQEINKVLNIDKKATSALVAFSLDSSEVLSMHFKKLNYNSAAYEELEETIELGNFEELFVSDKGEFVYMK